MHGAAAGRRPSPDPDPDPDSNPSPYPNLNPNRNPNLNPNQVLLPGGGRYEGAVSRGLREGEGECTYASGDVYSGTWLVTLTLTLT